MRPTLDRVKITYTIPGEGATTEYVSCTYGVQDLYDKLNYIATNYSVASVSVSIAPALSVAGLDAVVRHLEAIHASTTSNPAEPLP